MIQIFRDFLAFEGKNKNGNIIPAIFSLIHKEKNKDPAYFEFLENIIRRRSKSAFSKESLIKVLKEINGEITPELSDREKWKNGWRITSYFFFVLKEIDRVAIRSLLPNEYEEFVIQACETSHLIYKAYIKDHIKESDWDILPIILLTDQSSKEDSWSHFLLGCAFTWLLYKLKP